MNFQNAKDLGMFRRGLPWESRVWLLMRLVFQWRQDDDGDIVFVLFRYFGFIKYKDSTIFKIADWWKQPEAPKYVGNN